MNWYYAVGQQQQGPVTEDQLHALAKDGVVTGDTMVWREGMADWQPYRAVSGGAAVAPSATGGVVCAECGKSFAADEVVRFGDRYVCAACKPTFVQRMQEGAITTGVLNYATFGSRLVAKILDNIILAIVNVGMSVVAGMATGGASGEPNLAVMGITMVAQTLVNVAYGVFFLGKFGATPGKMACKLKVVRPDGSPLTYGRACGRVFAEILSGMICAVGYIMAAFDEEKRALHDRICDTRVIKKG